MRDVVKCRYEAAPMSKPMYLYIMLACICRARGQLRLKLHEDLQSKAISDSPRTRNDRQWLLDAISVEGTGVRHARVVACF